MNKIIYLLALLPMFANAWELNQNDVAVQASNQTPSTFAVYTGDKRVIIGKVLDNCYLKTTAERIIEVNNQPLKFNVHCESNVEYSAPISQAAQDYMIKQFRNSITVKVGDDSFSASGFDEIVKQLNLRLKRNKTAL